MVNQSESLEITYKILRELKKSCIQDVTGFGFASHWLKNWCKFLSQSLYVHSNHYDHEIIFDSHLKTPLSGNFIIIVIV